MAILKVYKSHIQSCSFFTSKGMQVAFIQGKFTTGNEEVIAELEAEIKSGHPHIYIDENEKEIDTEALSPLEVIKQEAYEQAKRDLLKQMMENRDFGMSGVSTAGKGIATTATVEELVTGEAKKEDQVIASTESAEAPALSPIEALKAKAAAK